MGLAAALTVRYWPEQEEATYEAVPAPSASTPLNPAEPSEEPSPTNPASPSASSSMSPSASPSAKRQQPAARQPARRKPVVRQPQRPVQRAPRVNTPPRPTSAPSTTHPATSRPASSRLAKPADVEGLTITSNTNAKIVFKWRPVSGADYYEVFRGDAMIDTISDTIANIPWSSSSISIGVAAVKDGIRGDITRIEAERPALDTSSPDPEPSDEGSTPTPTDPASPAPDPSDAPDEEPTDVQSGEPTEEVSPSGS